MSNTKHKKDTQCPSHANCASAAGLVYWIDIVMRFRVGFCVVYNLKRELIMDGGLIAHFYVRHNTFVLDFLSAIPSIAEVEVLLTPVDS